MKAREVTLKVPKLRRQTLETAIIERYRRHESSVEEALIEMYLAGISVRQVEDITEGVAGNEGEPLDGQRSQPADLQDHRGLARPADQG